MSYSAKYIDHFSNPRGIGEVDPCSNWSEVKHEGQGCFDRVQLTLDVQDGVVQDARFRARACSGTIAACSALMEMIVGSRVSQVENLTPEDIVTHLDGIPEKKQHSVELAIQALQEAMNSKT